MSEDIFKKLNKMNEDASVMSESNLSSVKEWLDTGSYALNAICSGSMYKGIPKGRIIGFAGPSGCGKTYIMNKIIGKFQKMHKDNWALIWDSEAAADPIAAKNVGADPKRIKVLPVDTVESCRNQIVAFLDAVIEKGPSAYGKYMIVIDSLGNLASKKEIDDASNDKNAADMGSRAKTTKSMMRAITYKAAKAGVTVLFSNHTYDDPASMYPSLIKNQAGGKGPIYLASILVQLSVNQDKDKDNDKETIKLANKVNGVTMSAMTVKNRFVPAFLKTGLELNFKTGLDKYSGIKDMAVSYGVIEQSGPSYNLFDGTKLGYYKNWKDDENVWSIILKELDKKLQDEICYNNESEIEELKDEVESLDD